MNAQKKKGLSGLLDDLPTEAPPLPRRPAPVVPDPGPSGLPEERAPGVPESQPPGSRTPEAWGPASPRQARRREPDIRPPMVRSPLGQTPELPKYLRLERKEFLAWPDQLTRLSILARVLNRNRGGQGERITANTLIRVAIALLLSHEEELGGATEDELRRSLGLP